MANRYSSNFEEEVYEYRGEDDDSQPSQPFPRNEYSNSIGSQLDEVDAMLDSAALAEGIPESLNDVLNRMNASSDVIELFGQMYTKMQSLANDKAEIEWTMKVRRETHLEDLETLDSEMEAQLEQERVRVKQEFIERERQMREGTECELQSIREKMQKMEEENEALKENLTHMESKHHNLVEESQILARDNNYLNESLCLTKDELFSTQDFAHNMKVEKILEIQERERQVEVLSKEAWEEREELLSQIESLQEQTQQLEQQKIELEKFREYSSMVLSIEGGALLENTNRETLPLQLHVQSIEEDEFWTVEAPPGSESNRTSHSVESNSLVEVSLDDIKQDTSDMFDGMNEHCEDDVEDVRHLNIQPERVFKIVFVGDATVGKTCFIQRFCSNSFRGNVPTTVGIDFQLKHITIRNCPCTLQLWDTAGQEKFRAITKQYFRKADGVILMYDITNQSTIESLQTWIQDVEDHAPSDACLMIVGNKSDLANEQICLSGPIGDKNALGNKDFSYTEVSSASGTNVEECMMQFASRLLIRDEERRDVTYESSNRLNIVNNSTNTTRGGGRNRSGCRGCIKSKTKTS